MGKIGDLWVRLGLKKQDFDKGIDSAEHRLGGFGKAFGTLKTVALGAFAAIAAAAVSAFKSIILESNKFGDQWRATVGGMQNAWHAFTSSLLNWDWEGFWSRVRGAYGSGKALAGATDALTEQTNSLKMRRADMEQENAHLRILMQDQNKTYEERAAAAKKYLENVEPLYQEEADIRRKYLKDMEKAYLEAAHLEANSITTQALEDFVRNGARLTAEMANDPNMVKIAQQYEAMGDVINNQLVEAYVNARNAAGAFEADSRRVFNLLNMATSQTGSGGGGGGSRYNAQRDKAKQIAKQAEDSLKTEEALLKEHYEEDIKLLEKYHIDTTARTQQYWNELAALIGEGLDEIGDDLEDFKDDFPDLIIDDDDLKKASERMKALTDVYDAGIERMKALKDEFIDAVVNGFSAGVQELTDQLFGLEEVNPGAILQALLSPLADMAIREGEILMAQGLGVEAVKESLTTLNGAAAVAAGAALMAIGAAAKSGLAALAKGGSGTTVQSYSGNGLAATGEVIRSELVVRVEGTLKGSDIVLSGTQTEKSWNR